MLPKSSGKTYDTTQLKQNLESWKLILVSVNNVIEWERKFDPFLIISLDTLIFGLLIFYNPSILSTISIIGLTMLLVETALPVLTNYLFKTAEWDQVSEAKYTRICERISNLCQHFIYYKAKLENVKKEKQPLYFSVVFFFLIFCAYVGQCVDNFLLTYLAVLVITLIPGARRHNILDKLFSKVKQTIEMTKSSIKQH